MSSFAVLALAGTVPASSALCGMDVDGDGKFLPTTDGLLMTRYLLGLRGTALTAGALGTEATRTVPADIEAYIQTPCVQAGWVGKGSGRLNDTGITFGGNPATGVNATCTSSGANIAEQDCSKGRDVNAVLNSAADGVAGFSFTKISNSGSPLSASAALGTGASDWACTYDNVTGLMWEVKTATGRRSSSHSYTSYSSDSGNNAGTPGTSNGGTCGDVGGCDTEKYAQNTNSAGLCGRSDWRIPHPLELQGIVHYGAATSPVIDTVWFPNTVTVGLEYWSSSIYVGDPTYAWKLDFSRGSINVTNRNIANRVRLVRAGL